MNAAPPRWPFGVRPLTPALGVEILDVAPADDIYRPAPTIWDRF